MSIATTLQVLRTTGSTLIKKSVLLSGYAAVLYFRNKNVKLNLQLIKVINTVIIVSKGVFTVYLPSPRRNYTVVILIKHEECYRIFLQIEAKRKVKHITKRRNSKYIRQRSACNNRVQWLHNAVPVPVVDKETGFSAAIVLELV